MASVYIDTASSTHISVIVSIDKTKDVITQPLEHRRAQVVLPLLMELLKKHNLTLTDITAVEVNLGPGSFTGVRVGVAIANALSFALNIPVNNQKHPVEPIYS